MHPLYLAAVHRSKTGSCSYNLNFPLFYLLYSVPYSIHWIERNTYIGSIQQLMKLMSNLPYICLHPKWKESMCCHNIWPQAMWLVICPIQNGATRTNPKHQHRYQVYLSSQSCKLLLKKNLPISSNKHLAYEYEDTSLECSVIPFSE